MDHPFCIPGLADAGPISVWNAKAIGQLPRNLVSRFQLVVDVFGRRSATAQSLGQPITDMVRLTTTDQRLYLYSVQYNGGTSVLGGIKMGQKKLFYRTETGAYVEMQPTCVLDFYVHESCQRQGIGRQLFEHVLQAEGLLPSQLAYDRPSPKLLAFLKRHHGLHKYVSQVNNFVVFQEYFATGQQGGSSATAGTPGRAPGSAARDSLAYHSSGNWGRMYGDEATSSSTGSRGGLGRAAPGAAAVVAAASPLHASAPTAFGGASGAPMPQPSSALRATAGRDGTPAAVASLDYGASVVPNNAIGSTMSTSHQVAPTLRASSVDALTPQDPNLRGPTGTGSSGGSMRGPGGQTPIGAGGKAGTEHAGLAGWAGSPARSRRVSFGGVSDFGAAPLATNVVPLPPLMRTSSGGGSDLCAGANVHAGHQHVAVAAAGFGQRSSLRSISPGVHQRDYVNAPWAVDDSMRRMLAMQQQHQQQNIPPGVAVPSGSFSASKAAALGGSSPAPAAAAVPLAATRAGAAASVHGSQSNLTPGASPAKMMAYEQRSGYGTRGALSWGC